MLRNLITVSCSLVLFVLFGVCIQSPLLGQTVKDQVGYTELLTEKGAALEDGTGVRVFQPEAQSGGNYMADTADGQFTGKTFTNGTPGGSDDSNGHATSVGKNFYGNTTSMTPGITDITGYDADDYIDRVLGIDESMSRLDPSTDSFDVGNHSYIAASLSDDEARNYNERLDFVINRDNTVMAVGANNGGATPDLFAPSYNAITVGTTNDGHSTGPVSNTYGGGGGARLKPDIVVPVTSTSVATPWVASAAALLRQAGTGTNAVQNEVIKSMLFAGATKEEFVDWDRTTTRPIDEVFGFGELNILNSYHIFEGGESDASLAEPVVDMGMEGWDYGDFDGASDTYYSFDVLAGETVSELSAALVWNIEVTDNDTTSFWDPTNSLANLDLELFDSTDSFLGSLVDSSLSTDYNLEHIYLNDLSAGTYTFRIRGDLATDYGFSWRITTAVPEPSSALLVGLVFSGALLRRRKA